MNKIVTILFLGSLLLLQGCFAYKQKEKLSLETVSKTSDEAPLKLSSVDVVNHQMIIKGAGLLNVTHLKIKKNNNDINDLNILSKTNSQILATAKSALSLLVGGSLDLIIETASGQSTFPITFTLDQMSASSGQVLRWDGTKWWPGNLATSQIYLGGWNAATNTTSSLPAPALSDASAPSAGEYYIVTTGGTQNLGSGAVTYIPGDWVISNGSMWEKIAGSFGGSGTTNYIPYFTSANVIGNSSIYMSGSSIGIGKTNPGSALDVKGEIRLSGSTSGYVGFAPAAVAGSTTYTLPAADGTNGQVLTTNASGVLSWTTISGGAGGTVSGVTSANADIGVANSTTAPVLTLNSGTGANQIVKLNASSQIPAIDGSLLTSLNPANLSAVVPMNKGGTGATTLGAVQSALGILVGGATTGSAAVVGTGGVVADKICSGDSSGGGVSCVNTTSSFLGNSISDESGTGALLFGTAPTISSPIITNIAPGANFTLTQNSVVPFTSEETGALANSLYLKTGNVGVGTSNPTSVFHVVGRSGVSGTTGTAAPAAVVITGGAGGNSSGAATQGGAGGTVTITGGAAGSSTGAGGVQGGAITLQGGAGGTGTFTHGPGAINLNTGGGYVNIGAGQPVGSNANLNVAMNVTSAYTSSSVTIPAPTYTTLALGNGWSANGNGAFTRYTVRNASSQIAIGYMGAISTPTNYKAAFVFGLSTSTTSYQENMRILATGEIGIGTDTPLARLDVADTSTTTSAIIAPRAATFSGTAVNGMLRYNTTTSLFEFYQNGAWVNFTTVSDGRLKTNITPVKSALNTINHLNPVFFDWDQTNPRAQNFGSKHQVGFIAQEVEKVLPEVVNKGEDSYRSVDYGKIVAVVVASIKDFYQEFRESSAKSKGIENEVKELRKQNELLKARIELIEKQMKK